MIADQEEEGGHELPKLKIISAFKGVINNTKSVAYTSEQNELLNCLIPVICLLQHFLIKV